MLDYGGHIDKYSVFDTIFPSCEQLGTTNKCSFFFSQHRSQVLDVYNPRKMSAFDLSNGMLVLQPHGKVSQAGQDFMCIMIRDGPYHESPMFRQPIQYNLTSHIAGTGVGIRRATKTRKRYKHFHR